MVMHTPLYPLTSGGVRRNHHLALEAAREHEVHALILDPRHDEEGFRSSHQSVIPGVRVVDAGYRGIRRVLADGIYAVTGRRTGRRRVQRAIDQMCASSMPQLVHLSSPLLRRYDFPPGIPMVADAHNVEHDNMKRIARTSRSALRRMYLARLAERLQHDETACALRCDGILSVSERDRDLWTELVPGVPVSVVPNGVDLASFVPRGIEREPRSMVFAGTMNYPPNDAGIREFLDRCFPLIAAATPDARLTIVGANPSTAVRARASDRVRVTGFVDDLRTHLERAEVCIVPLAAGGGTRLKILEAMAMGTPVVSTTIGCEGLEMQHGEHLLIADTPEAFSSAVLRLFSDPVLRSALASRARAAVRARFGWDRIGQELRHVYAHVSGARSVDSGLIGEKIP